MLKYNNIPKLLMRLCKKYVTYFYNINDNKSYVNDNLLA